MLAPDRRRGLGLEEIVARRTPVLEPAEQRPHVREHQRCELRPPRDDDDRKLSAAKRKYLSVPGPNMDMGGRRIAGIVRHLEETGRSRGPGLGRAGSGQGVSVGPEDGSAAHPRGLAELAEQALGGETLDWGAVARGSLTPRIHLRKNIRVRLARASWITFLVIAVIAVVILAINGYTGYSITLGAVGAAAAANLL